jgi:hypothetical protein
MVSFFLQPIAHGYIVQSCNSGAVATRAAAAGATLCVIRMWFPVVFLGNPWKNTKIVNLNMHKTADRHPGRTLKRTNEQIGPDDKRQQFEQFAD